MGLGAVLSECNKCGKTSRTATVQTAPAIDAPCNRAGCCSGTNGRVRYWRSHWSLGSCADNRAAPTADRTRPATAACEGAALGFGEREQPGCTMTQPATIHST